MHARDGVRAVFRHEHWFVVLVVPLRGFVHYSVSDLRQGADARIPAVVAVEADHVHEFALSQIE